MQLTDFTEVEKIEKGWSHEQKYKVTNDQGESFLLRITPIEQYEYKKAEFENMKMVSEVIIVYRKSVNSVDTILNEIRVGHTNVMTKEHWAELYK